MTFNLNTLADALCRSAGLLFTSYKAGHDGLVMRPDYDIDYALLLEQSGLKQKIKQTGLDGTILYLTPFNCAWITLPAGEALYLIGPTLTGAASKEQIIRHYSHKGLNAIDLFKLTAEYAKIPVIPFPMLLNYYALLFYLLRGEKADTDGLKIIRLTEDDFSVTWNEESIEKMRQRDFETARSHEQYVSDCVRNGDVARLQKILGNERGLMFQSLLSLTSLGPNELRSMKNNMISSIAILTRAAIDGGLPVEIAFPLSDRYILQIEHTNDLTSVIELHGRAIIDFADHVKNNRFKLSYSKQINNVCGYVIANPNKRILLSELADNAGLHPDTLSKRFRRETGMGLTDYIRKVKIEEAKILLMHTGRPITEIAYMLAYSSQSQFIAVFKQSVGQTPSKFRKNTRTQSIRFASPEK